MEKNNFPFVHIHPLDPFGKLEGKCCVCEKINKNEICYYCKDCNFYFCKSCSLYALPEEMKKLHQHELKPKKVFFWSCNLCNSCVYSSGMSMRCNICDFDICVKCFWNLNQNATNKVY